MSRRDEILTRVRSMPALPSSAVEAVQVLQDPDARMDAVIAALELDPGLTANVLRLANSSLLGANAPVETMRDAIVRLGFDRILQLVLTSTVRGMTFAEIRGYDMAAGELWRHSVAVALATQLTGEVLRIPPRRAAFTAGLLHDIGRIVLATFEENDADEVVRVAFEEDVPFDLAERTVLGIDHAELGATLLEAWGIPESVVEVVRWHHSPSEAKGDPGLVDLVHVADHLTTIAGIGLGRDGLQYRVDQAAAQRLGVQPENADVIVYRTLESFEKLRDLFEIAND